MTPSVDLIEAAGYALWPAREEASVAGWTVRATDGFTRRLNSATGAGSPSADEVAFRAVRAWFDDRSLPTIVRVTPLLSIDAVDGVRRSWGFVDIDPTLVLVRESGGLGPVHDVSYVPLDDPALLTRLCVLGGRRTGDVEHLAGVVARIDGPATGVAIGVDAVGLVAVHGDLAAVFSVGVRPDARRRGLATRVMAAADSWSAARGARSLFLQVLGTNSPAVALYEGLGFRTSYAYHYLVAPPRIDGGT